jgi:D-lactate dehydrogenase
MKHNGVLVNTARGKIVKTSALISWLKESPEHLAAVDVLEDETEITADEQELLGLTNVLVTPHTAFNTKEAEDSIAKTTAENILNFVGGKPTNII